MCGNNCPGWKWLAWAVVVGGLLLPATNSTAQDAGDSAKAPATAPADDPAKTATVGEAPATTPATTAPAELEKTQPAPDLEPATNAVKSADAKVEPKAPATDATAPTTENAAPQVTSSAAQPAAGQTRTGNNPFVIGLVVVALFVLPMLAGNYLAKTWKMPDHAWKISLVLGALAASIVIIAFGEFKFGPDLAGGITLVYE